VRENEIEMDNIFTRYHPHPLNPSGSGLPPQRGREFLGFRMKASWRWQSLSPSVKIFSGGHEFQPFLIVAERRETTYFVKNGLNVKGVIRKAIISEGGAKMQRETCGKPIHTRKIEANSYDLGGQKLLVEGRLRDTRIAPVQIGEEEGKPIVVHNIVARIWVQGPDLTITAAEAEMEKVPREICPDILPGVQKLSGLRIFTGFTQKVKVMFGGVRGCVHLTTLFLALGSEAVQGYFAAYGRKPGIRSLSNPVYARVVDSCHVWRRDGELVKSVMAAEEKDKRKP
jgi:hypothetical protein